MKCSLSPFLVIILFTLMYNGDCYGQTSSDRYATLKSTDGLVALWDFKEKEGTDRVSSIDGNMLRLSEASNKIPRIDGGPLSGYAIELSGEAYLSIPYEDTGALNVRQNEVTVIAWIKRRDSGIGFIAGMWNEYADGGKRQYGLFVNLPHYNGTNQVCGHISQSGKPTGPFPYSIDYSASKQLVPLEEWVCVGFTYDGKYIKSFLNGVFEERKAELISHTAGFEGYPDGIVQSKNPYYFPYGIGDNGSDFTVGAVFVAGKMGNFFKGEIGGLAVFDRALTDTEMIKFR
ncbi:LamG domain-containing protein [Parapedobacter tibetensis]|uniref:LamG domain-containing protein n=1 Tax=Parapedobacter tibetensis TaxID=2972951 RepID=UPI00214DE3A8|nr:LamG domain-containing protein [Parapedobacter tibetensis]